MFVGWQARLLTNVCGQNATDTIKCTSYFRVDIPLKVFPIALQLFLESLMIEPL